MSFRCSPSVLHLWSWNNLPVAKFLNFFIKCFFAHSFTLKYSCVGLSRPQRTGYWGYILFPFADLEDIMVYFHLQTQNQVFLHLPAICQDLRNYQFLSLAPHLISWAQHLPRFTYWQGKDVKGRCCQGAKQTKYLLTLTSCVPPHQNRIKSFFLITRCAKETAHGCPNKITHNAMQAQDGIDVSASAP